MSTTAAFDVIVLGSGLAGMTAALHTQTAGLKTLVLERRADPGGLCGTFLQEGYEFVIGCNDFGDGLRRELQALGVKLDFHHPKTRFDFGAHSIQLPPNARTAASLLWRLPKIMRLIKAAKRDGAQTMGQLIDNHIQDSLLADIACVLVYGMMRSPDDVPLSMMREALSKELGYGYDKATTPVGGPRVMIERMVQRFESLGGQLWLQCEAQASERDGSQHKLTTPRGVVSGRALLSSQGRWKEYPPGTKPGLEAAMWLLALKKDFSYPKGFHTLGSFLPRVSQELRRLEAGHWSEETSFHLFRSDLPTKPEHYTVNLIVPMPRGLRDLSAEQQKKQWDRILRRVEPMLPGFEGALLYRRFLSPNEYEARLQLKSAPSPWVPPGSYKKPESYDPKESIYYLGTSVNPPGEHAGAAALSGRLAAQEVLRGLQKSSR
jgi:phytoene dehydrogenase-like protein